MYQQLSVSLKNISNTDITYFQIDKDPRWLPLLLAKISNGTQKKNQLKFFYEI
jgi:hypothetical protein